MKRLALILLSLSVLTGFVYSQDRTYVTVNAGHKVKDAFTHEEQYRYPTFTQGKIVFKDGKTVVTKLNYCILVDEMQFVSGKDTMAVDGEKTIDYVQIMQDTFYYDKGFIEKLAGDDNLFMCVKQSVKISNIKKEGPMGTRSAASGAQSYQGTYTRGRYSSWVVQEDMVFSKHTDYYIGNPKTGFEFYKKGNVLGMFPNQKEKIEGFIREQKTDFRSREDLLALTEFLKKLN